MMHQTLRHFFEWSAFDVHLRTLREGSISLTKAGMDYPADRASQNSSHRPLSSEQRSAMMALAPRTVQRIPDCLRRRPMMVLQPASITPEPTNSDWLRNLA